MPGNRYLGIAGTNSRTSPIVYAALAVRFYEEITRMPGLREMYNPYQIEKFLREADFAYTLIPPDFRRNFGEDGLQSIVLSEFIKYFPTAELVVVEAPVKKKAVALAQGLLLPQPCPRIKQTPEGRFEYIAVNNASNIARYMQEQYLMKERGHCSAAVEKALHMKRSLVLHRNNYRNLKDKCKNDR